MTGVLDSWSSTSAKSISSSSSSEQEEKSIPNPSPLRRSSRCPPSVTVSTDDSTHHRYLLVSQDREQASSTTGPRQRDSNPYPKVLTTHPIFLFVCTNIADHESCQEDQRVECHTTAQKASHQGRTHHPYPMPSWLFRNKSREVGTGAFRKWIASSSISIQLVSQDRNHKERSSFLVKKNVFQGHVVVTVSHDLMKMFQFSRLSPSLRVLSDWAPPCPRRKSSPPSRKGKHVYVVVASLIWSPRDSERRFLWGCSSRRVFNIVSPHRDSRPPKSLRHFPFSQALWILPENDSFLMLLIGRAKRMLPKIACWRTRSTLNACDRAEWSVKRSLHVSGCSFSSPSFSFSFLLKFLWFSCSLSWIRSCFFLRGLSYWLLYVFFRSFDFFLFFQMVFTL